MLKSIRSNLELVMRCVLGLVLFVTLTGPMRFVAVTDADYQAVQVPFTCKNTAAKRKISIFEHHRIKLFDYTKWSFEDFYPELVADRWATENLEFTKDGANASCN